MKGKFVNGLYCWSNYRSCSDSKNSQQGLKNSAYSTMNRRLRKK